LKNFLTLNRFFPFLNWLPLVGKKTLKFDLTAGLTNAVVVLPQAIAFSIIAGLPPIYGLYTAMVTPLVAGLFGSSYHLVSGPTTTVSIALFTSVSLFATRMTDDFISLALTLTVMVGLVQFTLGVVRLGRLVNFISRSVLTGYTAGAAILIATNQMDHITGLKIPEGISFLHTWGYIFSNIPNFNFFEFGIGISTILLAIMIMKFLPKLPHLLLSMIIVSLAAWFFATPSWHIGLVGNIPSSLPKFGVPDTMNFETIKKLAPSAFAVAMLGLIEVVTISRTIAIKSKQKLNSNQEFIGLGLSNIVGGFFSAYAGSGSFTRSALNYESGAKTPMSSIFSSLFLMAIILSVSSLAEHLPMATMGGIILIIAYLLIDFKSIRQISKASKSEIAVLSITFLSTLLFDLQFAILVGVFFSLSFYLMRTSTPAVISIAPNPKNSKRKFINAEVNKLSECPQLIVARIDGSLFFGAIEHIKNELYELRQTGRNNILIVCSGINFVDVAGAEFLTHEAEAWRGDGGAFYLCSLKKNVRDFLAKGYMQRIGEENIFTHKEAAISKIYEMLDKDICSTCQVRIFIECKEGA